MAKRRFKLVLEVLEDYVLYHWVHDPPIKSVGGGLGRVWPNGALDTLTYEDLRAMGSGTHQVDLEEIRCYSGTGDEPEDETDDEYLYRRVRFELFAERTGGGSANWAFTAIMDGMTRENAPRIAKLLPDHHVERLREFARDIPATKEARDAADYTLWSKGRGERRMPDENLVAIREWFENLDRD